MDDQNQSEDYGLETQDYIDTSVEYVDESSHSNPGMIDVSSGTDFDYDQAVPDEEPIPYDSAEVDYAHVENVAKPIGMTKDIYNLAQEFSSNSSEVAKAQALEEFSQRQLARFTSPKVIGPLLLFYAYRGRLSYVERAIWGAIGLGAAMRAYGMTKPGQGFDHPLMKTVKGRVIG